MLNRMLRAALAAALVAGIATAIVQQFTTVPLILAAETYEGGVEEISPAGGPEETAEWAPEDGFERIFYTSTTSVGTAFGFALILLGLMLVAKEPITARSGLIWGVAAFAATGLAPALGLSPELPGSAAANLTARQFWWAGTVLGTAAGLWLILRVSTPLALIAGISLLIVPHLIGAPHPQAYTSEVPGELSGHFASASLVAHALLWCLTGAVGGYVWQRSELGAAAASAPA